MTNFINKLAAGLRLLNYPLNRFQNIRALADDSYTAHPTINNDTLHLMGWLDVAALLERGLILL